MGYPVAVMTFVDDKIISIDSRKIPAWGLSFSKEEYTCDTATIHEVGIFWDMWLLSTFNCEEGIGNAIKIGGWLWMWNVDGVLYALPIPAIAFFKLERIEDERYCE